jgi:flagellar protein FlaG
MANDLTVLNMFQATRPAAVGNARATAEVGAKPAGDPVQDPQAKEAPKESPSSENLNEMVSELNNLVQELRRELQFSVDDENGGTVVKVIDKETDEVIRQIPSEEVVALRRRLEEMAGVIFKGSA